MKKLRYSIFVFVLLLLAQCGIKKEIRDTTTRAVNVIDDAIAGLSVESANWQLIVQQAINDLPDEVQSTIRNEMTDLLNRAVAASGAEIRCDVDFLRNRLIQGLQNVKGKLLGQDPPALEPQLCNVVPLAVDMELPTHRRNKVEFYGYDFDRANIKVLLANNNGSTVDVTPHLDQPTHYHMTLNLGGSGVRLNDNSKRLVLQWNNQEILSIGILQQAPDICQSKLSEFVRPSSITFLPRHTRGDREYSGNGPNITCRVKLINRRNRVDVEIFMRAKETKSDWTTAEGTKTATIYRAEPGWEVTSIVGATESSFSYRDNDHELDSFSGSGPVQRFTFKGDGGGDDAGIHTRVDVAFNRMRFELKETGDCVPSGAITNAINNNLISAEKVAKIKQLNPNIVLQPN